MAAPTTIQHGAVFGIEVAGQIIASRQNGTLNIEFENADVSDADGSYWVDRLHTLKSWSTDFGAWWVDDSKKGNGQRFKIEIETAPTTWTELKCRTSQSLSLSMATLDKTSTCSSDLFREYMPDKRSATISTTVRYSDFDDVGRTALKTLLDDSLDGLKVKARFTDTAASGTVFTGDFILTSIPLEMSYDQPVTAAITLESAGVVARTGGDNLSAGLDALLDAFFANPSNTVAVVVGSDVAEATIFTGAAYLTQLDITADFDQPIQCSIALQGTGVLTIDNNPVS